MPDTYRTNCPRDCYDGCGMLVQAGRGDRVRVLGDPQHPVSRGSICGKCAVAYNGVFQDPDARLTSPLRRAGPKGSGVFEPISWEDALNVIADRFRQIINDHGPSSIVTLNYSGTLSLIAQFFPARWANVVGTTEVDYGTICNAAGATAWDLLFGTAYQGFDPRTARDSNCILVWGANPAHSAPHMFKHWFSEAQAKTVVIDPVRTETSRAADLHLQPRPGTDAALAFSLLHALQKLDAFDQAFIEDHTIGYPDIATIIDNCTPEWGERQTGVPVADIVRAAQLYANGPALLWCGQGLQRQPTGGNVMRAAGLLPALTGNVGRPGAGFYYLNYTPLFAGINLDYLTGSSHEPRPGIGALDLADHLLDGDAAKAFMVWNANPLASCADPQKLRTACSREDLLTVVIDLFETDTVRYADIVLPAASFLEFDDLTFSYFNLVMGAQSRVREPMGSSLPNQEIFRRLSRAMGLENPELYEADADMLEQLLAQCGLGYDFAELQRRGHFTLNGQEPLTFFSDRKFDTPSGRVEIASARAASRGLPNTPLPEVDPAPDGDQLRLLSPASKWRLNDSYANDRKLRVSTGAADIIINPEDARARNIESGDAVEVSNANGRLMLVATVCNSVLPGTVLSYKGRWPSLEPDGNNLNVLYAGGKSDMGSSTTVHGVHVSVKTAS